MTDVIGENQIRLYCAVCGNHTNHKTVYNNTYQHREFVGGQSRPRNIIWSLLQCLGCDNVTAKRVISYLTVTQSEIDYFPIPTLRNMPSWSYCLTNEMQELGYEVYNALNYKNYRLVAMGIRALIDMAIIDKVGDVGNFEKKLKHMIQTGFILERDKEHLGEVLDLGNAAAHRGFNPPKDKLVIAIEVLEHFLFNLYYLPNASKDIGKEVPRRTMLLKEDFENGA